MRGIPNSSYLVGVGGEDNSCLLIVGRELNYDGGEMPNSI